MMNSNFSTCITRRFAIRHPMQHYHKSWAGAVMLLGLLILSTNPSVAAAQPYLVGAQVYASGADGSNQGAYSGTPYQFSTNTSTSHNPLLINGNPPGITIPLAIGENNFTFDVGTSSYPINTIGLNLFFNTTGISFNPPYQPNNGIPGNLAAYTGADAGSFAIPSTGTNVQSFNSSSTSVNTTSYSGATSLILDGRRLSITQFSSTNKPSGSFTIVVAASVPQPGLFALISLPIAAASVSLLARRRRTIQSF
ncbi:MAG: hypothetical protein ACU837_14485 [Gammaproteobacteria bacterium]